MSSINNTGSAGGGTLKQALESAFRISEVFFKKIVINNLKVAIANNGTILIPETVISSLLTLYENGSFKTISPIVVGQTTVSFTDNTTYYAINIKDSDNSDQAELRFYYNDNYEITEIQFWGYGGSSSNEYRAFEFDLTIEGILKSDSVPSLSDLQSFINFIDVLKTEFTNLPTYLE
jgi:hypothetical protein